MLGHLLLHLTEQVDHHHTSLSICVSHSHSATRTGNQQFVGHVAVWEKTHTHTPARMQMHRQNLHERVMGAIRNSEWSSLSLLSVCQRVQQMKT